MFENHMQVKTINIPNEAFFEEAKNVLESGLTCTVRTFGNSMRPFFESERDEIMIKGCNEIKVNDIVLARTKAKRYVVHRVISITGDDITLMGDGNIRIQELSCRNDVIGVVVAYKRKGEQVYKPLNTYKWRLYSVIWTNLLPLRRYLLYIYRKLFSEKCR